MRRAAPAWAALLTVLAVSQYGECARLAPFVEAGKAVFHVECTEPDRRFCPQSRRLGLSSMRKEWNLGTWREAC